MLTLSVYNYKRHIAYTSMHYYELFSEREQSLKRSNNNVLIHKQPNKQANKTKNQSS